MDPLPFLGRGSDPGVANHCAVISSRGRGRAKDHSQGNWLSHFLGALGVAKLVVCLPGAAEGHLCPHVERVCLGPDCGS